MERGTATPDKASSSVGLGLFIADQIVESHGGSIPVNSTAEAGTTFTVHLRRNANSHA